MTDEQSNDGKQEPPLRAYFAAHAPVEVPEWFEMHRPVHPNKNASTEEQLSHGRDAKVRRYFRWRWHYADMMIHFQEETANG